jgi:hypothetical protein
MPHGARWQTLGLPAQEDWLRSWPMRSAGTDANVQVQVSSQEMLEFALSMSFIDRSAQGPPTPESRSSRSRP